MEIAGRDTISGLPRKIVITSEEIREALKDPVAQIIDAVTSTLERAEPELAADLIDNGICICGGGSLLRGMDKVLGNATGLKVFRAEDPLTCVARGTAYTWRTWSSGRTRWTTASAGMIEPATPEPSPLPAARFAPFFDRNYDTKEGQHIQRNALRLGHARGTDLPVSCPQKAGSRLQLAYARVFRWPLAAGTV